MSFLAFSPFFVSGASKWISGFQDWHKTWQNSFFGWLEQIAAWGKAMMSNWVLDWY